MTVNKGHTDIILLFYFYKLGGKTAGEAGNVFSAPVMHSFCVGEKVCCVVQGYKMTSIGIPFSDYIGSTIIKEFLSLQSEFLNKKNKKKLRFERCYFCRLGIHS